MIPHSREVQVKHNNLHVYGVVRHVYGVDKNGTLKLDRLNACVQFSEPRIGSLKADRVNGPLVRDQCFA